MEPIFEVDLITNITPYLKESLAFVTHKSPPKDYPKEKTEYADPKNYKYPLNSEKRVRSALSYWGNPDNRRGYTPAEVKEITNRIHQAAKKFGIKVEEDKK